MPEDISNVNDVILIRELQEKGSIDPTDLYLLQTTNQSYKLSHDDLVAALPDNSSIVVDPVSNKLKVSDNFLKVDIDLFDGVDQNHGELASSKAIKDYVDAIDTGAGGAVVFVDIYDIHKLDYAENQTYTYDVRNFNSPDSSYNSDRVVGVYVECWAFGEDGHHTKIQSNIGGGSTFYTLHQTHNDGGSNDSIGSGSLVFIPLKLGQKVFKIKGRNVVGGSGDEPFPNGSSWDFDRRGWRIIGVSQSTVQITSSESSTQIPDQPIINYKSLYVFDSTSTINVTGIRMRFKVTSNISGQDWQPRIMEINPTNGASTQVWNEPISQNFASDQLNLINQEVYRDYSFNLTLNADRYYVVQNFENAPWEMIWFKVKT